MAEKESRTRQEIESATVLVAEALALLVEEAGVAGVPFAPCLFDLCTGLIPSSPSLPVTCHPPFTHVAVLHTLCGLGFVSGFAATTVVVRVYS